MSEELRAEFQAAIYGEEVNNPLVGKLVDAVLKFEGDSLNAIREAHETRNDSPNLNEMLGIDDPDSPEWVAARSVIASRKAVESLMFEVISIINDIKTPDQWCAEYGYKVLDPDGWRNENASWDEPIDRETFLRRLMVCTIMKVG